MTNRTNMIEYKVTVWRDKDDVAIKTWTFTDKSEALVRRSACVYGKIVTQSYKRSYYFRYYITTDYRFDDVTWTSSDIPMIFADDVLLTG